MPQIRTSALSAIGSIIFLIASGTWIFHILEDWSLAKSFYFTVATLTTVGYGDLHPTSDTSRIVTSLFILVGVGIMITALTSIGSRYLSQQEKRISEATLKHLLHEENSDKTKQSS